MTKTKEITWSPSKAKTKDLKPSEYNPRKMTDSEKEDIENSIEGFGRVVPLIVNIGSRENVLIGGHQRWKIYKEKKVDEVDVMIPSHELTLTEEKELNLRLNKNVGSWDIDLLKDMGLDLLLDVGFDDEELQTMFDDVETFEDDFDEEKALQAVVTSRVKLGEIWELGNSRLLVGNSTNIEAMERFMNGELADLCYFDPPYNIGWEYGGKYGGSYTKKDDSKSEKDYEKFMNESITIAKKFSKPNSHFFYWCDPNKIGLIQSLYKEHDITPRRVCFWCKNNQNCTPKIAWNRIYEPVVYGTLGKAPYLNNGYRNANEALNQEVSTGNQMFDDLTEMIDLWLVKRDNAQTQVHATQKPVSLAEKPFKRCSAPGHIILSGFAGSGSDLIACEQLQRKWYGVEQDLVYATVILNRWEKFTGKTAKLMYENK